MLHPRWFACIAVALLVPLAIVAHAADLDGVQLPATQEANGVTLQLNGYGLRTYSLFGIHIYVAGLYLEHLNTDPDAIIKSPETKLLTVRFEHSVSADEARNAWREGFANNCQAPCHLDPQDVEQFLAMVPAMHVGDNYSLLFIHRSAIVTVSGQRLGMITEPQLAETILATFLGPRPASQQLKQDLLRRHT
jgi:hypothetical protein